MIPDLGRYTIEVSLAYGVSLTLLAGLVLWVWLRSVRMARDMAEVEARKRQTQ
jgi:heme exporter protein D